MANHREEGGPYPGANETVRKLRRNCLLCQAHRSFDPGLGERKKSLQGLQWIIDFFDKEYTQLRAQNASAASIKKAIAYKRHCMDLYDACKACDRKVDQVNRGLDYYK